MGKKINQEVEESNDEDYISEEDEENHVETT
jgi:hypothetical protein